MQVRSVRSVRSVNSQPKDVLFGQLVHLRFVEMYFVTQLVSQHTHIYTYIHIYIYICAHGLFQFFILFLDISFVFLGVCHTKLHDFVAIWLSLLPGGAHCRLQL